MYTEKFYVIAPNKNTYRFFGDFSFDKDAEDCMGTGTLKMPYHPQLWAFWEPGFTELIIKGGVYDEERLFYGRTRGIKQDGETIEISLQDNGWKLKQIYMGTYDASKTTVSKAFRMLVQEAGMVPVILGLKENYKIQSESGTTSTSSTSTTGAASTTTTSSTYNKTVASVSTSKSLLQAASEIIASNPIFSSGSTTSSSGFSFKNISSGISTITAAAMAGAISGTGKVSCGRCTKPVDGKWWTSGFKNYCPNCKKANTLKYGINLKKSGSMWMGPCGKKEDNPIAEGHFFCCNCDADYCVVCGKDHGRLKYLTRVSGPTQAASAASTTTTTTTSSSGTGSADTSSTDGSSEAQETPGTYEDELKKICEGNDLIFYTTQYNECILIDYPSLIQDIDKNAFTLKKEYMEYPSFVMDVNQFGYANTVKVKYANGTVTEQYEDLVRVFGEVPKTFTKSNYNKTQAQAYAKSKLATLLRDFAMEIQVSALYSGNIQPGNFIKATNPITDNTETYYVSGVNISHSPTSTLKASLTLLYAPKNPEVSSIPEISGGTGGSMGIEAIRDFGKQCTWYSKSSADYLRATKKGDCYAMSDYIFEELVALGYKARIIQYHSDNSKSGTHRTVQYVLNGKWVNFDYSGFKSGFGVISAYVNNHKIIKSS